MALAVGRAGREAVRRELGRAELIEVDLSTLCGGARRPPHRQSRKNQNPTPVELPWVIRLHHALPPIPRLQGAKAPASDTFCTIFRGKRKKGGQRQFSYTARPDAFRGRRVPPQPPPHYRLPPPVILPGAAFASLCLAGASRRASPFGLALPPAVLGGCFGAALPNEYEWRGAEKVAIWGGVDV